MGVEEKKAGALTSEDLYVSSIYTLTHMDSGEVNYAAGTVLEVSMDVLSV